MTSNSIADAQVGKEMIKQLPNSTARVYGDGAYDKEGIYQALAGQEIAGKIPPRRGGRIKDEKEKPWMHGRNQAIQEIREKGNHEQGRKEWKKESGYHKRSLAETAMSRFKMIFGERFSSRKMENQQAELYVKSIGLNRMTRLGMPAGSWQAA